MTPRDPDFRAVVAASFARQALMATLGARLERVDPGEVDIALDHRADLTQQNGFLHAGTVASIADSACGYAALSLCPPGTDVLAVEFKINLMEPARGPRLVACGRVLRAGRTLTTCFAEVWGFAPTDRVVPGDDRSSTENRRAPTGDWWSTSGHRIDAHSAGDYGASAADGGPTGHRASAADDVRGTDARSAAASASAPQLLAPSPARILVATMLSTIISRRT